MYAVTDGWAIPGQPLASAVLAAAAHRPTHAFALVGPSGVGQRAVVTAMVAAANCPRPAADGAGCGTCSDCTAVARGVHPGLVTFLPTGTTHRVEDVRQTWIPTAYRSTGDSRPRVLHVVDADRLTDAAVNALLKVLEEPPGRTVWVLEIADVDAVPDTVLSRCRQIPLTPWSRADLTAEAQAAGLDDDALELALDVAEGSPETLHEIIAAGRVETLARQRTVLDRLADGTPAAAVTLAAELLSDADALTVHHTERGKDELDELDATFDGQPPRHLVDAVKARSTRQARHAKLTALHVAFDQIGRAALAGDRPCEVRLALAERCEQLHDDLDAAVNPTTAVEVALLELYRLARTA